jgi:hypothetical protein
MPTLNPPQPRLPLNSIAPSIAPRPVRRRLRNPLGVFTAPILSSPVLSSLVLSCAVLLLGTPALAAMPAPQTPPVHPASVPARKPVHPRKRRVSAAHPRAPLAQAPPKPLAPAPPKAPNWPVNDPPTAATVTWDSHGLRIAASNSSLEQILRDISTDTGVKVQGLNKDERIFGVYGPGQVREVLSQLLDGTGYNVVMIGDQSRDEPLQVLLTTRSAVSAANQQPAASTPPQNYDQEMDSHDQPPPEQLQPPQPIGNGIPPRTPQQIEQEYEQRREMMQQLRENQQN